jgi:hypothetical protein
VPRVRYSRIVTLRNPQRYDQRVHPSQMGVAAELDVSESAVGKFQALLEASEAEAEAEFQGLI